MILVARPTGSDFDAQIHRMYGIDVASPKNITFQVTDACNLACKYCYQINKGKRELSFETAKKFIDLILSGDKGLKEYLVSSRDEDKEQKACILEFIGGEPMLKVELIDKIYTYFKAKAIELNHPWKDNIMISISSNGTLHFKPEVQNFLNKHKHHLSYSISIDGNKELHDSCRVFPDGSGSYDMAIAGVKDWMAKGNDIGSKITVSPFNVGYIYEASKQMVLDGYKELNINCVFEEGWELKHATTLYHELKKFADYLLTLDSPTDIKYTFFSNEDTIYNKVDENDNVNWCGGDGEMIAVDPDGRIFPCIRYMESSLGTEIKPLCIGDVDNGIGYNESCRGCLKCLHGITRRSQSTDECFYCPIGAGCSWCSAYNYQRFGTLNHRATFICNMHRAASLANVYYINKLYQKFGDKDKYPIRCPKEWAIPIIGEDEYNMLYELSREG